MKENKAVSLKKLISEYLVIFFITALIFCFGVVYLISYIYTEHMKRVDLFGNLEIQLKQYNNISESFLTENGAGMELLDSNLRVTSSKGIAKNPGYQYTPISFAKLISNKDFNEKVTYEIIDDKNNKSYTIILKQYFNKKTAEKISSLSLIYSFALFLGALVVFLIIFTIFIKTIYRRIKCAFDLIEKNISKTPVDKTKVDLSLINLKESRTVLQSYNNMLDELEQIKKEKESVLIQNKTLISNLSHDLKSPITTLRGYSELLLQEELTPVQQRDYLVYINQSATDLSELINLLFEQVKFQHTDFNLNLEKRDINNFLRDLCANYYMIFNKRGFEVNIEIDENPHIMEFDYINMKRCFSNILDNCLSHNKLPTNFEISTFIEDNFYFIQFKDDGIGISEENKKRIFEPFFQVDKSRSQNHGGLGLFVTKQIIEKHGGTITLKNEKNYKTIFEIKFKV